MNVAELIRQAGVVGAGGAGFPAHVKAGSQVEYVIANGAECEPLMHKDAELMARHAPEIVAGMKAVMASTGASKGIIGLKSKHTEAIDVLKRATDGSQIALKMLGDFYPTGDEFVLVYETTGRTIPPGGIPLSVGVVVQNVESLYNVAAAMDGVPVTRKYLTVAGAVRQPLSCSVPIGITLRETIDLAGGAQVDDYACFIGGAMMGRLTRDVDICVTKTTGGIIVLPGDHPLVTCIERPEPDMHQIGKSACDQCSYCTELCPRYLLGYQIEPHKVMRSLVFSLSGEGFWSQWGQLCCECGLCTLYACPEGLYPREACQRAKRELASGDADRPDVRGTEVKPHPMYDFRHIPVKQLVRRLGLTRYDLPAPLVEADIRPGRIRLPLKQHVGAPAQPVVGPGDCVAAGDAVAEIPDKALGARIHTSVDGMVREVEPEIVIEAQ